MSQITKTAQAKPTTESPRLAPTLAQRLRAEGNSVQVVRRFPYSGWEELFEEASDGLVLFASGSLTRARAFPVRGTDL